LVACSAPVGVGERLQSSPEPAPQCIDVKIGGGTVIVTWSENVTATASAGFTFVPIAGGASLQHVGAPDVGNGTTEHIYETAHPLGQNYTLQITTDLWPEFVSDDDDTAQDSGAVTPTAPTFYFATGASGRSRFSSTGRYDAIRNGGEPLFMAYEGDYFGAEDDKSQPSTVGGAAIVAALSASLDARANKRVIADFETFDQKKLAAEQRAGESRPSIEETAPVYVDFMARVKAYDPEMLVGFYNLFTFRINDAIYANTGQRWFNSPPGYHDTPEGQVFNSGAELSPPIQERARIAWIKDNINPDIACAPIYPFIDSDYYTDDPDLYLQSLVIETHYAAWAGRQGGCQEVITLGTTSWHYIDTDNIPAQGSENELPQAWIEALASAARQANTDFYLWRYGRYENDASPIMQYVNANNAVTGYTDGTINWYAEDSTETGNASLPAEWQDNVLDEATYGAAFTANRSNVVVADLNDDSGPTGVTLFSQMRSQGIVPRYADDFLNVPAGLEDLGQNGLRNKLGQGGELGLMSSIGYLGLEPGEAYSLTMYVGGRSDAEGSPKPAEVMHGTRTVRTQETAANRVGIVTIYGRVPPSGVLTAFWRPYETDQEYAELYGVSLSLGSAVTMPAAPVAISDRGIDITLALGGAL
jgi:hypothetical protein